MKSCWFHDWSKWEQYEDKEKDVDRKGKEHIYSIACQKRHCLKCGFEKRRKIT